MQQDKKKAGRPRKEERELLKPRFTVSLDEETWNNLKEATTHPVAFSRDAIIEKLRKESP
ncbi:hypothetical protein [Pseudoalteromonas luteoviolacea]|uniref:Uncharacterized protein n=1 Tax=Pseudoalteromonas luteoviolacea S4060-1 TaxID=1365257 RepID=A0A167KVK7_9GAMM|nr:hypothetical protein [Pseudoalteromonas luteoviolacea]KZN63354.1 hypothetical protein N478_03635 [Pseudoalteromonas luteoviolacea S4060-1]